MSITKEQVLENLEQVKSYIQEAENKQSVRQGVTIYKINGSVLFKSDKSTIKEAIEVRT